MKDALALLFPPQEGKQPFGRDQNAEAKESLTRALALFLVYGQTCPLHCQEQTRCLVVSLVSAENLRQKATR